MFAKLNPKGPSQSAQSTLIVVGVALMSLSALPFTSQIHSQALASEFAGSGCEDLVGSLEESGQSASCTIEAKGEDGAKITGDVQVNLVTVDKTNKLTGEQIKGDFLKVEVSTEAGLPSEGISSDSPDVLTRTVKKEDYEKIGDLVQEMFKKSRAKQVDKLADLREQKRKIDLCLIDRQGNDVPAEKQMSCRVGKWSTMSGEKAARYFSENLQPQVQEMLGSTDQATANQGKDLLRQINQSGAADMYVRKALSNLNQYGQETDKVRRAQQTLDNNPNATDAQKAQWQKELKASQAAAARSFTAQSNQLSRSGVGSIGSFDAMADLKSDLKSYQDQLDASYEGILATLAASTSASANGTDANNGTVAPTDGTQQSARPVRILPSNPWPAGVSGQKPTLPSTKPLVGTPVGG